MRNLFFHVSFYFEKNWNAVVGLGELLHRYGYRDWELLLLIDLQIRGKLLFFAHVHGWFDAGTVDQFYFWRRHRRITGLRNSSDASYSAALSLQQRLDLFSPYCTQDINRRWKDGTRLPIVKLAAESFRNAAFVLEDFDCGDFAVTGVVNIKFQLFFSMAFERQPQRIFEAPFKFSEYSTLRALIHHAVRAFKAGDAELARICLRLLAPHPYAQHVCQLVLTDAGMTV